MMKLLTNMGGILASLALILSVTASNSCTAFYYNQSKLPDKVKALRKF